MKYQDKSMSETEGDNEMMFKISEKTKELESCTKSPGFFIVEKCTIDKASG